MRISGIENLRKAAENLRIEAAIKRAGWRTVNAVAAKTLTQAKRDIAQQINVTQSYIAEQTTLTHARSGTPVAYIKMRMRAIRLARFDAKQLTAPAKKAKGDPRRGIPAGRKAAGVSVKIRKQGARTSRKAGFLIPLKNGNGMGVFVRTGRGAKAIKHKYGPSPDQLFARWRAEQMPEIKNLLSTTYASQLRYEISGSRR
jgi:hypothetical protein